MLNPIASLIALGGDRGDYVSRAIPSPVTRVLDIGCAYGWTLDALRGRAEELWGVDVDEAALAQARASYPHIRFVNQTAAALPFEENTFDVVILSEVIEHVGRENQRPVIDEAHRVLRPGGRLVFTAPYAGLFAWADPLDFKRRFPSIYHLYMRICRHTPATPIEVGHEHISLAEVTQLFAGRFDFEDIRYSGFLFPWLTWALIVGPRLRILPRRLERTIARFWAWESGVPYGRLLSSNIRLVACKKPGVRQPVAVVAVGDLA